MKNVAYNDNPMRQMNQPQKISSMPPNSAMNGQFPMTVNPMNGMNNATPCAPPSMVQNDSVPVCRLCGKMEKDKDIENGISKMIYPCKCAYPCHRKCLDQWRSVKKGSSFIKCEACNCSYRLEVKPGVNLTARKVKFGFLFARDSILLFLLIQLLIIGCAFAIERVDSCSSDDGCGTTCKPHCGEEGAPGGKLLNIFFIGKYEMGYKATYYLLGLGLFLAIVGVIGSIVWCTRGCSCSGATNDIDDCCFMCYISSASHNHGPSASPVTANDSSCSSCLLLDACGGNSCLNMCGSCCRGNHKRSNDCDLSKCCGKSSGGGGGSGSSGEAMIAIGAIVVIVAVVILVVFVVVGAVFGFIAVTMVIVRIWQRHFHILKRAQMAKVYVVKVKFYVFVYHL
eukprot:TRINITY_DN1511_c0_g2_i2.p1 TRINITY_DN1511_c0_g2~~TRINITY_DN1511_c0_g2_i2.p1  ORF type:complete len:396 (+),score=76.65 TRINITY_DN1511_c0_g2_i2:56-1243(+)